MLPNPLGIDFRVSGCSLLSPIACPMAAKIACTWGGHHSGLSSPGHMHTSVGGSLVLNLPCGTVLRNSDALGTKPISAFKDRAARNAPCIRGAHLCDDDSDHLKPCRNVPLNRVPMSLNDSANLLKLKDAMALVRGRSQV